MRPDLQVHTVLVEKVFQSVLMCEGHTDANLTELYVDLTSIRAYDIFIVAAFEKLFSAVRRTIHRTMGDGNNPWDFISVLVGLLNPLRLSRSRINAYF